MNEQVYLHGVGNGPHSYYDPRNQEVILGKILASGALLSMRQQGKESNNGFNGIDYVSLCDYEKKEVFNTGRRKYNTFYQHIINSLALVFPKEEIEVIVPTIVRNCTLNRSGYEWMKCLGESGEDRYSDLPDEVQVKDMVSLTNLSALTFPTEMFLSNFFLRKSSTKIDALKKEIAELYSLLKYFGYDIKIYDIHSLREMNEENIERLVLKR